MLKVEYGGGCWYMVDDPPPNETVMCLMKYHDMTSCLKVVFVD